MELNVIKVEVSSGYKFFTVERIEKSGTDTIRMSEPMFLDFLAKATHAGKEVTFDEDNNELYDALEELAVYELARDVDGNDSPIYDVYVHAVTLKWGEVRYDLAGEHVKEYKMYGNAENFVKKHSKGMYKIS